MIWPWSTKPEHRADSSYTDALIAAITANAAGRNTAFPAATSALEACAGFVGRAFASAEVQAPPMFAEALSPSCMALIGRALIRRGEVVFLISAAGGRLSLLPCESHDIDGGPNPATWMYRCTVGGPERTLTWDHVPAEGVVHLTYARDPERHWRGYGPLQVAQLAGRLSAATSASLANEAGRPHGSFLALPGPGKRRDDQGAYQDSEGRDPWRRERRLGRRAKRTERSALHGAAIRRQSSGRAREAA